MQEYSSLIYQLLSFSFWFFLLRRGPTPVHWWYRQQQSWTWRWISAAVFPITLRSCTAIYTSECRRVWNLDAIFFLTSLITTPYIDYRSSASSSLARDQHIQVINLLAWLVYILDMMLDLASYDGQEYIINRLFTCCLDIVMNMKSNYTQYTIHLGSTWDYISCKVLRL